MGAAYSQDLRDRVLAAYDRGMVTSQIAKIFEVSPAWARRIKQDRRETGRTTPRPMGGVRRVKIDPARLRQLVEQQPDGTLALSKPASFARRQDAPQAWGLNGALYVWQRAALARAAEQGFWSVAARPYVMPRNRSIDIDDLEDFEMAEWLMLRRTPEARP